MGLRAGVMSSYCPVLLSECGLAVRVVLHPYNNTEIILLPDRPTATNNATLMHFGSTHYTRSKHVCNPRMSYTSMTKLR